MPYIYTPYSWPWLLAAVLLAGLGLTTRRLHDARAVHPFRLQLGLGACYALLAALAIGAPSLPLRVFCARAALVPLAFSPLTLLALALAHTDRTPWLTRPRLGLLLSVPVVTTLLVISSPWHTLLGHDSVPALAGPSSALPADRGPWQGVICAYALGLALAACGLLLASWRARRVRAWPTLAVAVGVLLATIAAALFAVGATPLLSYALAPALLLLSAFPLGWALWRGQPWAATPRHAGRQLPVAPAGAARAPQGPEEALRSSEAKYRDLVENIRDVVFAVDATGRFTFISPQIRAWGYAPAEIEAHPISTFIREIVHPDDRPRIAALFARVMAGEIDYPRPTVFRAVTRDRQPLWIEETGRLQLDASGNVVGITGVLRDVTASAEAQRAAGIVAAVQRALLQPCDLARIYDLLAEKAHALVGDAIAATSILDESAQTLRMVALHGLDVPLQRVISMLGVDATQRPIPLADMSAEELRLYRSGRLERLEDGLHTLIGSFVPRPLCIAVEKALRVRAIYTMGIIRGSAHLGGLVLLARSDIAPYRDALEQLVNLAALAINRRNAEEALRESEERFRLAMDATSDALWDYDVATGQGYFSPAYLGALGYAPHELSMTDEVWVDLIHPEDRERVIAADQDCLEGRRESIEVEYRMRAKDGSWRWVLGRGKAVGRDAQGRALRMVGTHVDITERVAADARRARLEEERLQLERTLQQVQKTESLGRMAGAIAHHYNNLLGAVMGNLELALGEMSPGDPAPLDSIAENLRDAMLSARRAAEVSRLMLTYLGQTPAPQELLDLAELCRLSAPSLHASLPQGLSLEADLPSPGPIVRANAHQMHEILSNLVTNAWEAMPDGVHPPDAAHAPGPKGAIQLSVRTAPAGALRLPAGVLHPPDWQPEDVPYACLAVTDAGSGIAAEDMEHLFDPFFSRKFTGRGLGLPVVLGIVRAHHGAIAVESQVGRGSAFRVYLPVAPEPLPRPVQTASTLPEMVGGGAVLLVEDEPAVRRMAHTMLTRLGFEVLEAQDGRQAVEALAQRRGPVRVVLCDLTMPGMDGWETLAALRQMEPDLPVILASGYDQAQVMAGVHATQPQAFLSKPYSLAQLREALHQALGDPPAG